MLDNAKQKVYFYNQMQFKHLPIKDEGAWQTTLSQWKTEALAAGDEGILLAIDYERLLFGCKQLAESQKEFHCYFLIKDGCSYASSLFEITHAMSESNDAWLKLLDITLQPSLSIAIGRKDMDGMKDAYLVIAHTILHVLNLTFEEHPSKVLKIYGRTEEIRGLFVLIVSGGILDNALEVLELSVKLEGAWLVLTKNV